jgi:hypothetical protein
MTTKTLIFRPDESGKITATITEALVMEYARTVPDAGKKKTDKSA